MSHGSLAGATANLKNHTGCRMIRSFQTDVMKILKIQDSFQITYSPLTTVVTTDYSMNVHAMLPKVCYYFMDMEKKGTPKCVGIHVLEYMFMFIYLIILRLADVVRFPSTIIFHDFPTWYRCDISSSC
jgi:hypothetical protein